MAALGQRCDVAGPNVGVHSAPGWFGVDQSLATDRIGPMNNSVQFNVLMESINVTRWATCDQFSRRPEPLTFG